MSSSVSIYLWDISNCTNFIFETAYILHAYRLVENTFGANMATFQRFQFQLKIKSIENQFQFNYGTSSIVQISSLKLSLSPHAYGQVTITNIWCQTGLF